MYVYIYTYICVCVCVCVVLAVAPAVTMDEASSLSWYIWLEGRARVKG